MLTNVLIRLLLAHFLSDFMFQRRRWIKSKEALKWRAPGMYYHILVVGVLTMLFQWDLTKWYVALIIVVSHLGIDTWKSYQKDTMLYFVCDQLLHVLVICMLCFFFYADCSWAIKAGTYMKEIPNVWLLALASRLPTIANNALQAHLMLPHARV